MGMQLWGINMGMRRTGWKCEIVVNHGGDAGNPCGILSIAVAMTYDSNENNKFKEWRE